MKYLLSYTIQTTKCHVKPPILFIYIFGICFAPLSIIGNKNEGNTFMITIWIAKTHVCGPSSFHNFFCGSNKMVKALLLDKYTNLNICGEF